MHILIENATHINRSVEYTIDIFCNWGIARQHGEVAEAACKIHFFQFGFQRSKWTFYILTIVGAVEGNPASEQSRAESFHINLGIVQMRGSSHIGEYVVVVNQLFNGGLKRHINIGRKLNNG